MFKTQREKYAWLAALVDGEGSLLVNVDDTKKGKRSFSVSIRPTVLVTNTSKELMDTLQKEFGGAVRREEQRWRKNEGTKYKAIYTWKVRSFKDCPEILKGISPFLVIKKEKGDALVALCDHYVSLISRPLKDPRANKGWVARKRLANRETLFLLEYLRDYWYKRFYKIEDSSSYEKTLLLINQLIETSHENQKGERSSGAKLNNGQVLELRGLYKTGEFTLSKLAEKYGISISGASSVIRKKTWTNI